MESSYIDKLAWMCFRDGRALFVRSKNKDVFYTVGGKREVGETDEQALVREVREEIGVALIPTTMKHLHTLMAQAHGKPQGVMVRLTCYAADYVGEFSPQSEIAEMAWLSSEDGPRTSETGRLVLAWMKDRGLIE